MPSRFSSPRARGRRATVGLALIGLLAFTACEGDDGPPGPPGQDAPPPPIMRGEPLPGFDIAIESVSGGTGAGGNFRAGDQPTVRFTVTNATTGETIPPAEWAFGEVLLAGPSTNYQLILNQRDLAAAVTANSDGTFSYRLPPIPATVPEQINFTGMAEGELRYQTWLVGQPLPDGTYTIGISARKDYEVVGSGGAITTERDAASATVDVLFGAAMAIEEREVVTDAHCVRCHGVVRAHGENRYTVKNCLLCHTSGAEDPNVDGVPADDPRTPGRTIKFSTMIHKIHTGHSLPSVNGVGTRDDGRRDYTVPPRPYQLVGFRNSVADFSEVVFPAWPGTIGTGGMPRDADYDDPATDQDAADAILEGAFHCAQCHGDPDGTGGIEPPAQGALAFANPTRDNCTACHDDWDPEKSYVSNTPIGMPATPTDQNCTQCHPVDGAALAVTEAHTHPMQKDAPFMLGLMANVTAVRDVGGDGDGNLDPGESVEMDFEFANGDGSAIDASGIEGFSFGIDGPRAGPNAIYWFESRDGWFYGDGASFTLRAPDWRAWEEAIVPPPPLTTPEGVTVNRVVGGPIQDLGANTVDLVFARTIDPGLPAADVSLAAAAPGQQGYVMVAPALVSAFPTGHIVRIDPMDGVHFPFYAQVAGTDASTGQVFLNELSVTGVRLRHITAYPPFALTTSAVIRPVGPTSGLGTIAVTAVDPATNTVTLGADPGANAVLVSYVTDYVVPERYPGNPLKGDELGLEAGEWEGLPIVAGGYELRFYGWRRFFVDSRGAFVMQGTAATPESPYIESTPPASIGVTVGDAMDAGYASPIPATETCYSCHTDLQFHSGLGTRHGYDTCLVCHGVGGAEGGGESVEFRSLIHHLHAPAYPWFAGGIVDCESCHGEGSDSWQEPMTRFYPDATGVDRQDWSWRLSCGGCHSDPAAEAHMVSNTAGGLEACATCHGPGRQLPVDRVHTPR